METVPGTLSAQGNLREFKDGRTWTILRLEMSEAISVLGGGRESLGEVNNKQGDAYPNQ